MARLPYELEVKGIDPKVVDEKISEIRKEFEDKIKDKEEKYKESLGKELKENETLKKLLDDIRAKQRDSQVYCPTCIEDEKGKGDKGGPVTHRHEMKEIGLGVFECTGPECRSRKILVDPESDYICKDCGLPHKRPKDDVYGKKAACPFCEGEKMDKYDWKAKFDKIKKSRDRK